MKSKYKWIFSPLYYSTDATVRNKTHNSVVLRCCTHPMRVVVRLHSNLTDGNNSKYVTKLR
jgi:hypothetical protein